MGQRSRTLGCEEGHPYAQVIISLRGAFLLVTHSVSTGFYSGVRCQQYRRVSLPLPHRYARRIAIRGKSAWGFSTCNTMSWAKSFTISATKRTSPDISITGLGWKARLLRDSATRGRNSNIDAKSFFIGGDRTFPSTTPTTLSPGSMCLAGWERFRFTQTDHAGQHFPRRVHGGRGSGL